MDHLTVLHYLLELGFSAFGVRGCQDKILFFRLRELVIFCKENGVFGFIIVSFCVPELFGRRAAN